MALEQQVITDKLKAEGIDDKLGTGLGFETETDLDSWVENYKAALPEPIKGLSEYTLEELEEIAKKPDFGGAKGLQGLLDKTRQPKKVEIKKKEEPNETMKVLQELKDELKSIKEEKATETKKATAISKIKETFKDQDDIDIVLLKAKDLSEESVKNAIEEHAKYLKKLQPDFVPGSGKQTKTNSDVLKSWKKKHTKKE